MDIVLGVSMAPTAVRIVLAEGENADGVTVDHDNIDVTADSPSPAPTQVISAILGTRESAAEGGHQLLTSGVTWTDPVEAAALRDALAAHEIQDVTLVSAFMAAAALTQAVGNATNYARTALLFVEPYTATLAVVNTADGSIAEEHRKLLPEDENQAVTKLVEMVSGADWLETRPEGVVVVGSGVDIPLIKPALEAATSLALSVPEEPEMALARGAALASAHAQLFAASTQARAYALARGIGDRPEYRHSHLADDDKTGIDNVAYSAVTDEVTDNTDDVDLDENAVRRRRVLLAGSSLSVVVISAVVALEIALAINIRPTVALRPSPSENFLAPTQQAPPPVAVQEPEPKLPAPVAAPRPIAPRLAAPPPVAAPPPPVPAAPPPPVLIPIPPRAPPPAPRLVPRGPLLQPRAPLPAPRPPRERGLLPRLGGPPERGPLPRLGGPRGRGPLPGLGGPRIRGPLPGLGGGRRGFGRR